MIATTYVDHYYIYRSPGIFSRRALKIIAPLVKICQPADTWNLEIFIADWVKLLTNYSFPPISPSKNIFIFGCYRGQFTHDLLLSILLAWRGHRVTYGYLPKLQSPTKEPLEDHPGVAAYLNAVLGKVAGRTGGRVNCVDLSIYRRADGVEDDAYFLAQLRADIIMKVRQEKFDEADPEVNRARAHYSALGRSAQQIALAYLSDHRASIDLCLIANGASFENGYFCQMAKKLGIPVNTHEKFAFSKVRVVTHGDAFFQFCDLDKIWARRRQLGFLDEPLRSNIIGKGWDLLNQRRNSSGNAWGWQYQKASRSHTVEQLREQLGIEKNQFALVCPNVPFDAGYDGWLEIFPSMRDWLLLTVEALLKHDSLRVVVRAHPAETRPGYGREQIAQIFREAGLHSERLILLPGDSKINTYDLMPLCKFAAVFASTTGVEIAMHGKPVIAGASVYYARCGITAPAFDCNAYFTQLNTLATSAVVENPQNADDAAMLYFIFHYLLQWPYPYDKPSDIAALPPKALPSHSSMSIYMETLDVMAMNVSEFEEALPDLMASEQIERRWGFTHFAVEKNAE